MNGLLTSSEAEYECLEFCRYGTYTQTSKVECNGILLDASMKIYNKLSYQIDLF